MSQVMLGQGSDHTAPMTSECDDDHVMMITGAQGVCGMDDTTPSDDGWSSSPVMQEV